MIRAADIRDVDQVAMLLRASFDPQLHDFMIYAQHGINRFIGVHLSIPTKEIGRRFLVDADATERIRAFAEFQIQDDETAFLSYICVAGEARGQGIATAIIEYFLSDFPNIKSLKLDVFSQNLEAISLYNKLGFESCENIFWFVRELPHIKTYRNLVLENIIEGHAMHSQYGFCKYRVKLDKYGTVIGRIGSKTIRCFNSIDFLDDDLMCSAMNIFIDPCKALFICSENYDDMPGSNFLFQTSLRLQRDKKSL